MKRIASLLFVSIAVCLYSKLRRVRFATAPRTGSRPSTWPIAIWFLFGAVMSVMGGIGAFSFHLWRHGRMPIEPHQELTQEDLSKYE